LSISILAGSIVVMLLMIGFPRTLRKTPRQVLPDGSTITEVTVSYGTNFAYLLEPPAIQRVLNRILPPSWSKRLSFLPGTSSHSNAVTCPTPIFQVAVHRRHSSAGSPEPLWLELYDEQGEPVPLAGSGSDGIAGYQLDRWEFYRLPTNISRFRIQLRTGSNLAPTTQYFPVSSIRSNGTYLDRVVLR
jgi:hypothetical protein